MRVPDLLLTTFWTLLQDYGAGREQYDDAIDPMQDVVILSIAAAVVVLLIAAFDVWVRRRPGK